MPDIASLFQPMSCSPFYDRRGDDQRRLEVGLFCYHTYVSHYYELPYYLSNCLSCGELIFASSSS
jgi:hypothetical protein